MTDAARHGSFSPSGSGTAFPPAPDEPPVQGEYSAEPEEPTPVHEIGIDPAGLADDDLLRELGSLHRTRLQTLRHGPDAALDNHLRRTAELETEYLARHPGREIDQSRLTQDF